MDTVRRHHLWLALSTFSPIHQTALARETRAAKDIGRAEAGASVRMEPARKKPPAQPNPNPPKMAGKIGADMSNQNENTYSNDL